VSTKMTEQEREQFLKDVRVGVLSVMEEGRGPLTVPVWYDYDHERGVWLVTDADSRKGKLLRAARRASLCAQDERPPYRYVSVEGPVEITTGDRERDVRPLARRYLGAEGGDRYVEQTSGGDGETLLVTLRPARWLTVDYGKQ
jgi:PPOX class probable F420-dependent enzyme